MTKIKITALTDRVSDDEILAKLKKIGVKIKDKPKEGEITQESAKVETSQSGETLVETRVASTIIRRRVQTPPRPKEEPGEEKELLEEKKAEPVSIKLLHAKKLPVQQLRKKPHRKPRGRCPRTSMFIQKSARWKLPAYSRSRNPEFRCAGRYGTER